MRSETKVMRLDEIEAVPGPGSLTWLPVRHTLGVRAFGCNAYVAAAAGEDVVEPHRELDEGQDPADADEELYFVAAGHARFTIDEVEHDAPRGTYVFIPDPGAHRHAVALEAGTTVLSFGAPARFEPSAWEWYFRASGLMRDPGRRAEARPILVEAMERFPGNGSVLYNLACLEALEGNADAALDRLREAVAARPAAADWARDDEDFAGLRDDPRFAEVLGKG